MLSNTVLSPTLKTEVNSCPPPQVTILAHTRCAPGDRQHGAGVPPSGKQPAARPPLPGAGHGTRALLEPGTEHTSSALQPLHCPPVAASPFPGLIYCRGCFKEATEITWYNSTWDKWHGSWQVGAEARRDKDYSCSHNQTFPQISAMCPGSDLSTLKKQAQQSPDDPLKTTPKVQQDTPEGKSLTVF